MQNIVKLISELIESEMQKLGEKVSFLQQSQVTVYDPEQGEVQVEVVLPVHLTSLRELPDLQDYLQQADDAIEQYVPAKATVLNYYNQVKDRLCRLPVCTRCLPLPPVCARQVQSAPLLRTR